MQRTTWLEGVVLVLVIVVIWIGIRVWSIPGDIKELSGKMDKTDEALMALNGFFDRHFGGDGEKPSKSNRKAKPDEEVDEEDDEKKPESGAEHLIRTLERDREVYDMHFGKEEDSKCDTPSADRDAGPTFTETNNPLHHTREAQRHLGVLESLLKERKD